MPTRAPRTARTPAAFPSLETRAPFGGGRARASPTEKRSAARGNKHPWVPRRTRAPEAPWLALPPRTVLREVAIDTLVVESSAARRHAAGRHHFTSLLLQTARLPFSKMVAVPLASFTNMAGRTPIGVRPPPPPRYRLSHRLSPPPALHGLAPDWELHYPGYPAPSPHLRSAPPFPPGRGRGAVSRESARAGAEPGGRRGGGEARGRPAQETKPPVRLGRAALCLAGTVGLGPMAAAEAAAAPAEAALDPSGLSPKEEGELEDGEISDDDNNGFGPCGGGGGSEPGGGLVSSRPYSRRRPPPDLRGGISLSSSGRRFPRSRHQPPPEMGHLHGHGGYRPKDSFRSHPPPMPAPRMSSGSHSETGPRLSFWERSHNALDRFRFRGRPYRGGGHWGRSRGGGDRGGNPPGRPPGGGGGAGFSSSQGWREPSPRKCILETWEGAEVARPCCWGGPGCVRAALRGRKPWEGTLFPPVLALGLP